MIARAVMASWVVGLALSGLACGDSGCVLIGSVGFLVTVVDAESGQPIVDDATRVVAVRDGVAVELSGPSEGGRYQGVEEPGRYRLEVTSPGYEDWVRDGIEVKQPQEGCAVSTVSITVELTPTGG